MKTTLILSLAVLSLTSAIKMREEPAAAPAEVKAPAAEEKKGDAKAAEAKPAEGAEKAEAPKEEANKTEAVKPKEEAPADLIWGGSWKKYSTSREKKNDCDLNESVNWLGTGMCKYSWECKGARMCEGSGWCSGNDACDEVLNT